MKSAIVNESIQNNKKLGLLSENHFKQCIKGY